ncbi:MAG: pilus assembly protein PilM [Candidatus Portnoybacteria bacterium]|nr:pilus assembly protein PilM [Candidatus Portnoybacteria bacterium]
MFALDLSENRIRVLELLRKGNQISLAGVGEKEFNAKEEIPSLLKTLVSQTKPHPIKSVDVAFAIPEEESFTKIVQLPKKEPEELKLLLKEEVGKILPYSQEEVYWDWKVTGPQPKENAEHLDIIIVAAPKKIVDSYTALIEESHFYPALIETEANALLWGVFDPLSIHPKEKEEPILVVNLGTAKITIVIFAKGAIRFSSSMKTGIAVSEPPDYLAMEWSQWVKTNKKDWLLTEKALMTLGAKINEYIEYYKGHLIHSHEKNSEEAMSIVISGAWANFPELLDVLGKKLKIPITKQKTPFSLHPSYTVALGLALRGVYEEYATAI